MANRQIKRHSQESAEREEIEFARIKRTTGHTTAEKARQTADNASDIESEIDRLLEETETNEQLLEDIDGVLEANAEVFVQNYTQRGGQ